MSVCSQALDLEGDEWERFSGGIANLAAANEKKPDHFKSFQVTHLVFLFQAACLSFTKLLHTAHILPFMLSSCQ